MKDILKKILMRLAKLTLTTILMLIILAWFVAGAIIPLFHLIEWLEPFTSLHFFIFIVIYIPWLAFLLAITGMIIEKIDEVSRTRL